MFVTFGKFRFQIITYHLTTFKAVFHKCWNALTLIRIKLYFCQSDFRSETFLCHYRSQCSGKEWWQIIKFWQGITKFIWIHFKQSVKDIVLPDITLVDNIFRWNKSELVWPSLGYKFRPRNFGKSHECIYLALAYLWSILIVYIADLFAFHFTPSWGKMSY